ncbi:DUF4194 domain-containing protein [Panacagrimonas sp.]|uniref:DUF4194 domain-containing protein n=1 Tax=Panacagrimonas sp. TaxID=2480088 RepID=UPI003B52D64B
MLTELQRIVDHGKATDVDLRNAASRLLREQFLFRNESRDRVAWDLVREHFTYFTNLFEALGWTLHRNEHFGYVGATPDEGAGFTPIKVDETVILLILRKLFEEGVAQHMAGPDGLVVTGLDVEREHQATGRPAPMATRMKAILQMLERRGIVSCEFHPDMARTMITVRSVIRIVTGDGVQARLSAFIKLGADLDGEPETEKEEGGSS